MNQLPENSLRIYDVNLVTSYLIGLNILLQISNVWALCASLNVDYRWRYCFPKTKLVP